MELINCIINGSKGMSRERWQEFLPTIFQRSREAPSKSLTSPVCQRWRFQEERIDVPRVRCHKCGIGTDSRYLCRLFLEQNMGKVSDKRINLAPHGARFGKSPSARQIAM